MITKTHLTQSDIKSYLNHSDPFMRRAAAEYLERFTLDSETADRLMDAIKVYGAKENLYVFGTLPHAPFTLDQYREILERAKSEDEVTCTSLHSVLCHAPISFLKEHWESLRLLPHIEEAVVEQIEHKISLESQTPAQIWEDLKRISHENTDQFEATFDYDVIADKISHLSDCTHPTNDELLDLMLEEETEGEWLEIFLVELLGKRRVEEAVPLLVNLLEDKDADVLVERVLTALAQINAPETLELLKEKYEECDDDPIYRMILIDAMCQLRVPEVKSTLKFALGKENDPAIRTLAYMGLCQCFDAEGVKLAIKAARSGDFDPEFASLPAVVVAYADMLGLTLEERKKWVAQRDLQEAEMEKKFQEIMDSENPEDEEESRTYPFPIQTFTRGSEKVGRNDPCPCGSGKKHKNCCLIPLQ